MTIDAHPTQRDLEPPTQPRRWWRREPTRPLDPAQVEAVTAAMLDRESRLRELRAAHQRQEDRERRQREIDEAAHAERVREQQETTRKANAKRRAARRAEIFIFLMNWWRVVPLVLVNLAAVGGQISFAYAEITSDKWPTLVRVLVSLGYALASETVALTVGSLAHEALLEKHYREAASLRRWAYGFAAVFGALNYWHFADKDLAPTALAVTMGLFSLASPWLWGLHSRRKHKINLRAENPDAVDIERVEFGKDRRRMFPLRTRRAQRYALDHGITQPLKAWEAYNAYRGRTTSSRSTTTPTAAPAMNTPMYRPLTDARTINQFIPVVSAVRAALPDLNDAEIAAWLGLSPARLKMVESATAIRNLSRRNGTPAQPLTAAAEPTQARPAEPVGSTQPAKALPGPTLPIGSAHTSPSNESSTESTNSDKSNRPWAGGSPATGGRLTPGSGATWSSPRPAHETAARKPAEPIDINTKRQAAPSKVDDTAIAAAYERLRRELGREPSGTELGDAAGVSKASANRWKSNNSSQDDAGRLTAATARR